MREKLGIPFLIFIALLLVAGEAARAQESPLNFCDIAKSPKSFDGKMVRVRGTLSVHFEDFSLAGGNCDTQQGIWLTFGGDVPGIVASTFNDSFRKRGVNIKVNGVPYGIKKDENFRRLYALIAARHGGNPAYRVTATLVGQFFAGTELKQSNGQTVFGGYGHLGCCALLVITEVLDAESVPHADLNIRGTVLGPDGKGVRGFVVFDDVLGGSPPETQQTTTDEKGNFSFSNSGQMLRFEDPNYRPLALPVEPDGTPIRVRLEKAGRSDRLIPACLRVADSPGRIGFSVLFALPEAMESSPLENDEYHGYYVFPHGGAESSSELIIARDADETEVASSSLDSKWSEQRWIKDSNGTVVGLDARGRTKQGVDWRVATFRSGDLVRYGFPGVHLRSPTSALDKIIDSACIAGR